MKIIKAINFKKSSARFLNIFLIFILLLGQFLSYGIFPGLPQAKPVYASSAPSNWWDSDYGYRKKLLLTANESNLPEGYQTEFTVDTKALFDAGKLRADGRDLKLVYHDGATATELNYKIGTPQTLLLNTIDADDTNVLVDDVNNLPATGSVVINNEVIAYTSLATKDIATPDASEPGNAGTTANINDGDLTSLSNTFPGDDSGYDWYSLNWDETRTLNRVRFKEKAYNDGWIASYTIQYWNESDWVNVSNSSASKELPANGWEGYVVDLRFDEVSTTKIRIYAQQGGAATFIGLYEMEAYYSPALSNQARTTNSLGGVSRAQGSTTAATHNAGAVVKLAPSSYTTSKIKFEVQKTIQPGETDDNYYLYYGNSSSSTASGTNIYLTQDDFTDESLGSAWTWRVPVEGPTYSIDQAGNGYFNAILPTSGTFDYWNGGIDTAPSLLRSVPLGDWSVETKVMLEDDESCCTHTGLMVKFDTWNAYMWGLSYKGEPATRSLRLDRTGTADVIVVAGYTAEQVYLRVRKVDRTYYFDYKQNLNDAWVNAGSDSDFTYILPQSAGFFIKSWGANPYLSARFDEYGLSKYVYHNDSNIYSISLAMERPYNTSSSSVSAANSKVEVFLDTVVVNSDESAAFTVTVNDSYGDPLSGKTVSVSSSRDGDVVTLDSSTTNSSGQVTGKVMSYTSGTSVLTATASSTEITDTAAVTFTSKEPYDYTSFSKLQRLPYIRQDSTVEEWNSHDQTGGNLDREDYLYMDGGKYVITDERGAGVVTHMWFTAQPEDLTAMGDLEIYVDGSETAVFDYAVSNFFSGANSPLLTPLVDDKLGSSGGLYSYLQIPYTTSLKIVTTGPPKYYHVGLRKFSNTTDLTAFTGEEDPTTQNNILKNTGVDFKSTLGNTVVSGDTTLAVDATANLLDISGNGSVQSIKLTIAPQTADVLNNTYIKAYWDGEESPSVNAPLSFFFGSGNGQNAVKALPFGMDTYADTNEYYFYLPMPYKTAARIDLVNNSATNITALSYEVQYRANLYQNIGSATGYLKTNFVDSNEPASGAFYTALDVSGRGHMVGIVYKVDGETSELMEGDHMAHIDGSLTPQMYGTGTEDFFFGGWGFEQGNFTTPLHGNASGSFGSLPITMYRALLTNPISYRTSLKFEFEHGGLSTTDGTFSSLAFYYHDSDSGLTQSDTLDIGNSTSEYDHSYTATDVTSNINSTTYYYEGDDTDTGYSDNGRQFTGYSQFNVSLSSGNRGVLLRRRSDYSVANQQATVAVDGQSAGTWYIPGNITDASTMRWRDDWFFIPASLTRGKSSATIKITNSGSAWNEFYYWVYSMNDLVPPRTPGTLTSTSSTESSITWSWTDNSDNESGFYVKDGSGTTKCTVASVGTTSCEETGLSGNTSYSRYVVAYNDNGNSLSSGTASDLTLADTPTSDNITSDKASATWYRKASTSSAGNETGNQFTFTNALPGGFGGNVEYFRYTWDTSATHTWTGEETQWSSGTLTVTAASDSNTWYLHLKGYNSSDEGGTVLDLGPFYYDNTTPAGFSLDGPGNNGYTKDERPMFKWKAVAEDDTASGLSRYKLEVDNGETGDFTIDGIPVSGTSDYITDKYVIHFENFSDADSDNNYISVYTKSSIQWGPDNNDGKLKEGKRSWKVSVFDNAGNFKEESRTVFVDRTIPGVEVTHINGTAFEDNLITSSKKPIISGKITDGLAGDKTDSKVSAGAKSVEVKIEKQNGLGNYDLYSLATITTGDKYWTADGKKITDNSEQSGDKYSNFSYTPSEELPFGAYKITLIGRDDADNAGSQKTFYLTISSFESIATPEERQTWEEKIAEVETEEESAIEENVEKEDKDNLEITKPNPSPAPIAPTGLGGFLKNIFGGISKTYQNLFAYFKGLGSSGGQAIGEGSKQSRNVLANLGGWFTYAAVSFGEIVLDNKPTTISNVKVESLTSTSAVITWKTNHRATSKVNYGETLDYGQDTQSNDKVYDHRIEITGLKPGTKYYYEVMSQSKNYVYDAHHEFITPEEQSYPFR